MTYELSLEFIQSASWDSVFLDWRQREEQSPAWRRVATKIKGWPDWESWRMFTAHQLGLPKRAWSIYRVIDPATLIPTMLLGPYTGWQSRVSVPNSATFAELMTIPKEMQEWSGRSNIVEMGNVFPTPTTMIGLTGPNRRIVLIEGHHRAVAVALAAAQRRQTSFGQVFLHLAELQPDENQLLDRVLARGSTKEPRM